MTGALSGEEPLIYWSVIKADDTIETKLFPGRDQPHRYALGNLADYARSTTINEPAIDALARIRRVSFAREALPSGEGARRRQKLVVLQARREASGWDGETLADDLARAVYRDKLTGYQAWTREFAPTL